MGFCTWLASMVRFISFPHTHSFRYRLETRFYVVSFSSAGPRSSSLLLVLPPNLSIMQISCTSFPLSLSPHSHSLTHTHNTHRGENTYVPVSELASKPVPFLPVSSTTITKSLSHSSLSKTYRKKLIVAIVKAIDQSGVTSFPPSLPKEIVSNLSLSRRKSSRSRTSRLIQVGKHSVLRENDYDMENGITTISGSVQSQQLRDVVRLSSSLLLPLSLSNITTSHSNTSRYDLVPHLIFFVWTRCLLSK